MGSRLDDDPKRVASVGRALREAGGVAVRMEASGGAFLWDHWLEALESGDPYDLYALAVVLVGDQGGPFFTCGMTGRGPR